MVGCGNSVNIWSDPWLPSSPDFKVHPRSFELYEPIYVSKLIDNGQWKIPILSQYFLEQEIRDILKIPLPSYQMEDKWTWHYTKNGAFSVKSAYVLVVKDKARSRASTSACNSKRIWKKIWKLRLPSKIRMFAWKVLHDGIQTRANLCKRGVKNVDPICPMCGESEETTLHCFFKCPDAGLIWWMLSLCFEPGRIGNGSFLDWFEHLYEKIANAAWWETF